MLPLYATGATAGKIKSPPGIHYRFSTSRFHHNTVRVYVYGVAYLYLAMATPHYIYVRGVCIKILYQLYETLDSSIFPQSVIIYYIHKNNKTKKKCRRNEKKAKKRENQDKERTTKKNVCIICMHVYVENIA